MSRVITLAVILSAFCLSAEAQTVTVTVLNEAGAEIVLKAAEQSARQKSAPSAIASSGRATDSARVAATGRAHRLVPGCVGCADTGRVHLSDADR